ncbi:aldehyde dehydrogenase family protein [Streptomyces sp. NPDC002514]|uniref:MBL fold metallo-hydrolase n=1 Tax=unclassified Streptomyces TaxID=2593676 RepID=UPI00369741D3
MAARVEHLVTSGQFTFDGGTWDIDSNVWLVADGHEVVVIDAAHDAGAIAAAAGDRVLTAIVCTHAHNDHIDAAPALAARTGAPVLLHEADLPLWKQTHPEREPDAGLADVSRRHPLTDDDDAVRIANDSAYGLGGSVWTDDVDRGLAVARRIRTGTIGVNGYLPDIVSPFGGVKDSGMGRELPRGPRRLSGPPVRVPVSRGAGSSRERQAPGPARE